MVVGRGDHDVVDVDPQLALDALAQRRHVAHLREIKRHDRDGFRILAQDKRACEDRIVHGRERSATERIEVGEVRRCDVDFAAPANKPMANIKPAAAILRGRLGPGEQFERLQRAGLILVVATADREHGDKLAIPVDRHSPRVVEVALILAIFLRECGVGLEALLQRPGRDLNFSTVAVLRFALRRPTGLSPSLDIAARR